MTKSLDPFRFLLIAVSGWMNQQQLELIDYLQEENRVLREQLGPKRLRFNDDQPADWPPRPKELLREVALGWREHAKTQLFWPDGNPIAG